jgi:serine/threonine-protein kinase RsbW
MSHDGRVIRLEIPSDYSLLDIVQLISDQMGGMAGLDEDSLHWVGVALRETVINAIKHGNRGNYAKRVFIEFAFLPPAAPTELVLSIRDQGEGFEAEEVADPLAPENVLKSSGRGIFFMRSFMDDVILRRADEGGMEVRLVKKLPHPKQLNPPPQQ